MEEKIFNAALAGLLWDIEKFSKWANGKLDEKNYPSFIKNFVPKAWQNCVVESNDIVEIANKLANAEQEIKNNSKKEFLQPYLTPILTQVSLGTPNNNPEYYVPLRKLIFTDDQDDHSFFPSILKTGDENTGKEDLWNEMLAELNAWKKICDLNWEQQDNETYFTTLLAIFRKYMWCIPSDIVDVALYDHMRLVSSISACLQANKMTNLPDKEGKKSTTVLVRGDLSGIQNFIYRITRPESKTEHVAKRLRGRSFYLSLLVEIIVDWILREFCLPPTCALFVGGGRFDLMLPSNSKKKLDQLTTRLDQWLIDKFRGELSMQISSCELLSDDFKDMRNAYLKLDKELDQHKHQKWSKFITDPGFFEPMQSGWHVCSVCQLEPLSEPGICNQCQKHESIGKYLPHTRSLAFYYTDEEISFPAEQIIEFPKSPFQVKVVMISNKDSLPDMNCQKIIFQLNQTENFIHPGMASSFRFIANEAPIAQQALREGKEFTVEAGEVLHFEALAELSTGAKRLGILKADVDRLGLIMGTGLSDDENQKGLRPTLSRIASLSSNLDLFFAGWLNQICRNTFNVWKKSSKHDWLQNETVSGAFYIIYSGGDDLFLVGPWDAVLLLAKQINDEFQRFCGYNPALSISAGFVQVKPRYPVQKFAELVSNAELAAKNGGRNRLCLFGDVVPWQGGSNSFSSLMILSDTLINEIKNNTLSRGILADLGEVYRQHFSVQKKTSNPMWTPRLFYTLSRRLSPDKFNEIGRKLLDCIKDQKILIPVSITSLKTRKE
jgi:CRISPR-associated protein Csm1